MSAPACSGCRHEAIPTYVEPCLKCRYGNGGSSAPNNYEAAAPRVEQVISEARATVAAAQARHAGAGPLTTQVGGGHYKSLAIQPVEYIHKNGIGYFEGNVIKYVTRWRDKGGIADLEKAKHYIDLLIELEGCKQ